MLGDFRYHRPTSLADAVRALAATPGARPIAGGTDLLPNLRRGIGQPSILVDVSALPELTGITESAGELRLGAAVPLADLAADPVLRRRCAAVAAAAETVAGPTHRASATVGGNLCQDTRCVFYNQSEWWRSGNDYCLKHRGETCHVVVKNDRCYATYHGDLAPALMALAAEAELLGPRGIRRLPLASLFREDGKSHLTLAADEFLTAVIVPDSSGWVSGYDKARVRDAIDFPLAGVAAALRREGERLTGLRLAITGTNSAPLTIDTAELLGNPWTAASAEAVNGKIRKAANVLKTTVMGPKYRRRVVTAMSRRLLDRLWAETAG